MSRKNRYKFRNREANRPVVANVTATPISTINSPVASGNDGAFAHHKAEYRIISSDLVRLVVLNGIMLAAVLALYYVNRSSGIVEKLFNQIF